MLLHLMIDVINDVFLVSLQKKENHFTNNKHIINNNISQVSIESSSGREYYWVWSTKWRMLGRFSKFN